MEQKFHIDLEKLNKSIPIMRKILKGVNIPVINTVQLRYSKVKGFTYFVTNYDVSFETYAKSTTESREEGCRLCIPFPILDKIARDNKDGIAVATLSNLNLSIKLPSGLTVNTEVFDPNDAQCLQYPETDWEVNFSAAELKSYLERTIYASSTNGDHVNLAGAYCHLENGKVAFVATDSFRMARIITNEYHDMGNEDGFLMPNEFVYRAIEFLNKRYDEVKLMHGGRVEHTGLMLEAGDARLWTRIPYVGYVNFRNVIHETYTHRFRMETKDLETAIKELYKFRSKRDKLHAFVLQFIPESNQVKISYKDPDNNSFERVEEAHRLGSNASDISEVIINASFLLDALKHLNSDTVIIRYDGKYVGEPIVIENYEDSYQAIIVTMRS